MHSMTIRYRVGNGPERTEQLTSDVATLGKALEWAPQQMALRLMRDGVIKTGAEMTTVSVAPVVEIPADVKDNSMHTVRVQWRGVRDARPDEVESGRRYLDTFGYTLYEWDDVDRDGTRVTLHRFVNRDGQTVDLYATYYYTRVKCDRCDHSYASRFVKQVGEGWEAGPYPLCDNDLYMARRVNSREPSVTLLVSEPLIIGQHD